MGASGGRRRHHRHQRLRREGIDRSGLHRPPPVGKTVEQGDTIGEVESVKAVSDLYAPVAGEVVDVNESLPDNLQLLSDDPYGDGWIIKVRLAAGHSFDHLMDHAAYEKHCAEA